MFCSKCGKELKADSRFCMYCGAAVPVVQPIAPEPAPAVQPVQMQAAAPAPTAAPEKKPGKKKTAILVAVIAILLVVIIVLMILLVKRTIQSADAEKNPSEIAQGSEQTTDAKPGDYEQASDASPADSGQAADSQPADVPTPVEVAVEVSDFSAVNDEESAQVIGNAGLTGVLAVKDGERLVRGRVRLSRDLTAEEVQQFSYAGEVMDSAQNAVPATVYVGTDGTVYMILSKTLPTGNYTVNVRIFIGAESYVQTFVLYLEEDVRIRYIYYCGFATSLYCYDTVTHEVKEVQSNLYHGKETNGFYRMTLSGNTLTGRWILDLGTSDEVYENYTDVVIPIEGNEQNSAVLSGWSEASETSLFRKGNHEYTLAERGVNHKDFSSGRTEVMDIGEVMNYIEIENNLFLETWLEDIKFAYYVIDMHTGEARKLLEFLES